MCRQVDAILILPTDPQAHWVANPNYDGASAVAEMFHTMRYMRKRAKAREKKRNAVMQLPAVRMSGDWVKIDGSGYSPGRSGFRTRDRTGDICNYK